MLAEIHQQRVVAGQRVVEEGVPACDGELRRRGFGRQTAGGSDDILSITKRRQVERHVGRMVEVELIAYQLMNSALVLRDPLASRVVRLKRDEDRDGLGR